MVVPGLWGALLVGFGGFAGSVARYGLGLWLNPLAGVWPLGTLAANTLGCFIMGGIAGWPGFNGAVPEPVRLSIMVGFCGGFTTLSSLMFEAGLGVRSQGLTMPLVYVASTLVLGGLALWAGYSLARH